MFFVFVGFERGEREARAFTSPARAAVVGVGRWLAGALSALSASSSTPDASGSSSSGM
jgi:hypothetical protein